MKIDNKGKVNGKFNIIDVFVILLIIVVAAGIFVRFGSKMTSAVKTEKDFRYTVKITGVRQYTVDALEKKGVITDKKSEKIIGEIEKVDVFPAEFQSTTASGEVVETVLPERFNCLVTLKSKGKESNDAYYTEDENELSAGRTIDIFSKYVKTSGEIKDIEVLN